MRIALPHFGWKCRRRGSPNGEANCNRGAGGRANGTSSRGCRTANCMTLASPPPSAGPKSKSHPGADEAGRLKPLLEPVMLVRVIVEAGDFPEPFRPVERVGLG